MEVIILSWIFCAILGGGVGATKGRAGEGILWGALLGPFGVFCALFLKNQKLIDKKKELKNTKKCPHCFERIKKSARICRFCNGGVEMIHCPYCKIDLLRPNVPIGSFCECFSCRKSFKIL